MIELGQLERRHEDLARRNTRVVVISVEGPEDAQRTQADFPHLTVLADQEQDLSRKFQLLQPGAAPDGKDVDAPTTILLDGRGVVRWLFRPSEIIARLPADDVLKAVDAHIGAQQ
jgi:peroxiredoxin